MKRNAIIAVLLSFLLLPVSVLAEDQITEITLASEAWEGETNKDGTGLYWDIFRAVYEPVGIKVIIMVRSYAGSIKMVKQKKADAMVASALNEMEEFNYGKWHFDTEQVTALSKTGKEWKGPESMKGKKVGFIKDYGYDEYFDFPMVVVEYDTREAVMRVLDKDRLDFWLDAEEDMVAYLEKTNRDKKQYRMEVVQELKLYLGFAGTERGKKLAEIFDEQFEKLLKSGEIKKMFDKWKVRFQG